MQTNETRVIDLTVQQLENLIGKTVKNNLHQQANTTPPQKDLLNIKEAAEYLSYSVKSLYGKVHFRTIPFIKKEGSNKLFFSRAELNEWLRSGKKKTKAEISQDADNYVALKK